MPLVNKNLLISNLMLLTTIAIFVFFQCPFQKGLALIIRLCSGPKLVFPVVSIAGNMK